MEIVNIKHGLVIDHGHIQPSLTAERVSSLLLVLAVLIAVMGA